MRFSLSLLLMAVIFCSPLNAGYPKNEGLDITNISLPSTTMYVQNRQVTMMGQKLSLNLNQIRVTPNKDKVLIQVDLKNFRYQIPHIRVKGKLITNCYHTTLFVGYHSPNPLYMIIPVVNTDGTFQMGEPTVKFKIADYNYAAQGPSHCKGKIFPRPLMTKIIRSVFQKSKATVEKKVEETILEAIPELVNGLEDSLANLKSH